MTLLAYLLGVATVPAAVVVIVVVSESIEAAGRALRDRRWNHRDALWGRAHQAGYRQAREDMEEA